MTLDRLALHTITTKPLSLQACLEQCTRVGIRAVCPWVEHVEAVGVDEAARMLSGHGMHVPAYVRGGFFVHPGEHERGAAIDTTRSLVDDAAALGADCLVIVPGSHPDVPLAEGRRIVADALAQLCNDAAVDLALEPLHPMYAADRSCVNTLAQARRICEEINHPRLRVALDVYHTWWDESIGSEIAALGSQDRLAAFHVCDFLPDTSNLLTDRGMMGEGCIPIKAIQSMMETAGFRGWLEVEILSERCWARDQASYVDDLIDASRRTLL